jgi:hypothetical protein
MGELMGTLIELWEVWGSLLVAMDLTCKSLL